MRIKVELEMSGNQFLDLLRRVPKAVAEQLLHGATSVVTVNNSGNTLDLADSLWNSAVELIKSKKR